MVRSMIIVSSMLLLIWTLILVPEIAPAHAQTTGTVCIIPSGSSSCPSSPATITGTVGSQLRVSVFIQNSEALNGFEITLIADHTILQPFSADLTGSVFGSSSFVIANCIGGSGTGCTSTDNADTLHVAAVCVQVGPCPTPSPTTGLLFTGIYNVVSSSMGIPIAYQTGCSPSSVSETTTCVEIVNAGTTIPENVQTAVFTTGDFSMTANPASLSLRRSSQAFSTITLTSISGFAGTISLSANASPAAIHSPSTSLAPTSVMLSSGGSTSVLLTVSTVKNTGFGAYTVTVTGTSGSVTHTVTVTVTVTH